MKTLIEFTPLIFAGLLFFSQYSYATSHDRIEVNPVINIDLSGLIDSVNTSGNNIVGAINPLSDSITGKGLDLFRNYFEGIIADFNRPVAALAKSLLVSNPEIEKIRPVWNTIVGIISTIYVLVFFFVGLLFTLSFLGAEKKAIAKEWFKGLVIMIILIAFSFEIYKTLLNLLDVAGSIFVTLIPENLFELNGIFSAGPLGAILYTMSAIFAVFTFFIRQVFVLLGAALFPVGIFLYFNMPLRSWGVAVFNLIGAFLVLQIIDIIILAGAALVGETFFGQANFVYLAIITFTFVGLVNIGIMFIAGLKAALSFGLSAGSVVFRMSALAADIMNSKK